MSDAPLEARLAMVERGLADVECRLRALEATGAALPAGTTTTVSRRPADRVGAATDLASGLALVGRTLVIFAGAYLLRALTESGTLGVAAGAALGLSYAGAWTIVAFRVGAASPLSATFFGGCTVVVGLPLLYEASTRFALLAPTASAAAVAATTGLVLGVAWRRDLHALAWIATLGACALAAALLVATGATIAFVLVLVALGVATLWLGYDREWKTLRWVAAAAADLAVAGLAGRALTDPPRDAPALVMTVQLLLLVGYLGSIAVRTLVRGRNVVAFEVVQTAALLLVGLAGAMVVASRTGTGLAALGLSLTALAAAAYAVAFAFLDRQQGRGANFHFYTSLALVLALSGSRLMLGDAPLSLAWAALAVSAGWAGERYDRHAMVVHSVVYVVAAMAASGLAGAFAAGFFGSPEGTWPALGPAAWIAAASAVTCLSLSTMRGNCAGRFAQGTLAVLTAVSAAAIAIVLLRTLLPLAADAPLYGAAIATLRSGVLAVAAILVAWLGHRPRTRSFAGLLYPVLALGGLKLLLEDLRTSPPALLFVALGLYGVALIVCPRIARAQQRETPAPVATV